jgi:hypothetical protein
MLTIATVRYRYCKIFSSSSNFNIIIKLLIIFISSIYMMYLYVYVHACMLLQVDKQGQVDFNFKKTLVDLFGFTVPLPTFGDSSAFMEMQASALTCRNVYCNKLYLMLSIAIALVHAASVTVQCANMHQWHCAAATVLQLGVTRSRDVQ